MRPPERRTKTIDAFIDLVLEIDGHPRPDDVAQRAEVSIASLYRYFADLDELRRDTVTRVLERYPHLFDVSAPAGSDRGERISSFAASRLALHETLHSLQLLWRAMTQDDPSAQQHVDRTRAVMAEQIRRHFEPELTALSPARCDDTVTAIAALTSVESWEQFRRSHGRSPAQVRRAWISSIDHLLPTP